MEGYLELRHSKWLKSNKKYYFMLTTTRMVYFDSREDSAANPSAPEGFFNLRDVLSVELSQKHKQCIQINTTTQTLVLKAKEDSVLWRWMGSIKENAAKLKVKETETKSTKSPSTRSRRKGSLQQGNRRKLRVSRSFNTADQDVNKALKKIRKEAVEGRKPFGPLRPGMREARSEEDIHGGINNLERSEERMNNLERAEDRMNNLERAEERRKRESGNSVVSRESLGSIGRVLSLTPGERVKRKSGNSLHSRSREGSVSGSSSNLRGTRSPRIPITSSIAKSMIVNNESHMRDSLDYEVSEDFDNLKADTSAELRENFDTNKADTSAELRENFDTSKADTSAESSEPADPLNDDLELEYAQKLARFNDNNNENNRGSVKFVTRDDEELEIKPKRRNSLQPILKGLGWLTIRRSKKKGKDHPHESCSRNNSIDSMEHLDSPETPEKNINSLENSIDKLSDTGTSKDDVRSETEQVIENSEVANKENNEKHYQPNIGESKFKHHRGSIENIKDKDSEDGRSRTGSMSSSIRARTLSETSDRTSDDITDGSVTENVKSKVSKWKQKSIRRKSEKAHKSSKYSISGPMPVVYQKQDSEERRRILAEIDAQCSVEFSTKDIEDILNYPLAEQANAGKKQEEEQPPEVPAKPVKFQIRQLELIQAGNINPRPDTDEMDVMLKLESLKVVANLDAAIHENAKEETIYDTPRPLNLMTNHYINRISMQSDSDISVPDVDINTFRPRIPSISSRGSAGSYESTVVMRQKL